MRASVSGGTLPHSVVTGLPEKGSTGPPSSTVLNQRVSLSCWLSARSPVVTAKARRARLPLPWRTGLVRLALTLRIVESKACSPSASCGRHEDFSSPPAGSAKSTRAGLISSTICGSVSWAKDSSERRLPARERLAFAAPPRRTVYFSPLAGCSVENAPPAGGSVSSRVVLPAGSAWAPAARNRKGTATSAARRERAIMGAILDAAGDGGGPGNR